ncbi:hypothetical protein P152DRAFT_441850 [Eremomyces bilateralis CBS 781.70]|uniref:Rhodopsin domain-containing protein n=1 Tax=Eremomyces bilateralis CBS 781.70 TaxID=1392243 RepID=A0A6G1FU60_9PEZI|nr:uncharacterized protein P152DRAFT_441850 [Eremomyces bilateralis CBS 781.70]KAF1809337.1 hypothetical protein P152DRAFT_441850 [Eremomyces bilateralis CBS 781.70]
MLHPQEPQVFKNGHLTPPTKWVIAIQSILVALATCFVCWRMYARISLKKRIAADDIFIVLGLGLAIGRAVAASLSSQIGWASRMGPQEQYQVAFYQRYFERRLWYALSAMFTRLGVLTYYLRLFPTALRGLRIGSWVLIIGTFMQCLQLVLTLAILCSDIDDLYRGALNEYHNPRCSNAREFTYSGALVDAVLDALIYALPIPYIWGLRQIRLGQRVGLAIIFGIGLIACVFALLQIPFIIANYRTDAEGQQWFGSEVSLFIAIELALGLVASSLPDLRGLIARSWPNMMGPFRHAVESSEPSVESNRRSAGQNAPPTIGGHVQANVEERRRGIPGAAAMASRRKVPDWLRSTLASSVMRDTVGRSPQTTAEVASQVRIDVEGAGDHIDLEEGRQKRSKERVTAISEAAVNRISLSSSSSSSQKPK